MLLLLWFLLLNLHRQYNQAFYFDPQPQKDKNHSEQHSLWLIKCNKSEERKSTIQTEPAVRSRNIVETQDFCYNGYKTLDDGKKGGKPMHISYQPLWNTLKERGMRKEDLRLAAGLTTNMIANMGKGKNISMETLVRICEALNCGIMNVIKLEQDNI